MKKAIIWLLASVVGGFLVPLTVSLVAKEYTLGDVYGAIWRAILWLFTGLPFVKIFTVKLWHVPVLMLLVWFVRLFRGGTPTESETRPYKDRVLGIDWAIDWAGTQVHDLVPLCPNCSMQLDILYGSGRTPVYAPTTSHVDCPCGFTKAWETDSDMVRLHAKRELERRLRTGGWDS